MSFKETAPEWKIYRAMKKSQVKKDLPIYDDMGRIIHDKAEAELESIKEDCEKELRDACCDNIHFVFADCFLDGVHLMYDVYIDGVENYLTLKWMHGDIELLKQEKYEDLPDHIL